MRFHCGAIPEDNRFDPEEGGWKRVREPGPIGIQILALPALVVILAGLAWLIFQVFPRGSGAPSFIGFTRSTWLALLLFIPVHELIHALCHPKWGLSPNTLIGLWPSRLLFYAYYHGQVERNRLLVAFAMPFIILSLLPIALLAVLKYFFPVVPLATTLAVLSFVNGAAASGDVIGFCLVLFQIPSRAIVRNKGWKSYWRYEPAPNNQIHVPAATRSDGRPLIMDEG